jgi:ribose transport system permease protein
LLLMALYVQSRTYFGRDVYSVGGNPTAARLAGIRVPRVLTSVYATSGACSGLAGIVAAAQVGSATPVVDATIPLQAIAAVLLGGTSLSGGAGGAGGVGGVGGTALGVLFIGLVQNGLGIADVISFVPTRPWPTAAR